MKGRRPKPTALKLLQGNPGHRKIDILLEPQPVIGLGAPPDYLSEEAKQYWFKQGPKLVALGTLGESDAELFGRVCQAQAREKWLSYRINDLRCFKRLSARDDRRLRVLETDWLKNSRELHRLEAEFGIGAGSRTRIRVKVDDGQLPLPGLEESDSPFARALRLSREV